MFTKCSTIQHRLTVSLMERLGEHDKAVINSIFNPLIPFGEALFSQESNFCEGIDLDDADENSTPEVSELQKKAIFQTELKNYEEALKLFEKALEKSPKSAKILNDRAQCLRLVGKNEEAMNDLNKAIESSKGEGKVGIRLLCQRGILFKIKGKLEEARIDFSEAAKRGSKFAKSQLIELNPYAAMCNNMLREMTKLN